MGEDPGVIRAQIEQTRERVGDEVDALSYKTDVPARTQDYIEDKKDAVKPKLSGAKETLTGPLPDRRARRPSDPDRRRRDRKRGSGSGRRAGSARRGPVPTARGRPAPG